MSNLDGIRTLSNRLLICLWGVLISALPLSTAFWFYAALGEPNPNFDAEFPFELALPMSQGQALAGYPVAMIGTLLTMAITWQLIRLFRLYRDGEVFSGAVTDCYRKAATLLILLVLTGPLQDLLLGVALSIGQPESNVGVNLSDSDLTLLLVGIIVRLVAKVMAEAAQLHDEQALTI
ncbi:DUF2975 domain-containing protein [Marinobacterium arenosum]|uniref:DUF2975 domain-containing protein n=1 Tax=Marinobacterium arenosum TaxID=2862496 RepID=UPI001C95CE86|nr:DUF2975 domain-containing protein [Marinobacterium arenosum]MBY4678582.1 DUF2975 domain-containing protein [Marinobacterium arenosum]